jgi:choice-of-anchor B domain-containing protein
MGVVRRSLILATVFAVAFLANQWGPSPTVSARSAETMMAGFGGIVLVGDGEIFAAEAANQFRPGMVYVFRKNGGAWQEAAVLTAPEAAVLDQFGASLALSGDRLFVGAGNATVHVFTKQGMTWSHSGTVPSSAVPGETPNFGNAIAATGDWLLVGKQVVGAGRGGRRGGADAPPPPPGAVFAFQRGANGQYAYHSTIVSDDTNNAGDEFGASIAAEGPMVLIGATGRSSRAGIVHEYALDNNVWTSQRSFAAVGVQGNEAFGSRLALSGDQVVVAAPGDAGGYGAAYVFRRVTQGGRRGGGGGGQNAQPAAPPASGNFTWQEVARLTAPSGLRQDRFGTSLAADDKAVWVGAPGAGGPGRVFVFNGNATGFQIDGLQLVGPDMEGNAAAGQSVDVRGNVAAVGAVNARNRGGAVFIYERDTNGMWREQPMLTTPLDEIAAITGEEKRCSGDGKVDVFDCGATDLLAFLPPSRLTHDGHYIEMNDSWGWTDAQTKKEWAIVGRRDGTTFVDITTPSQPRVVADLPLTAGARPASWRDMKIYKDHAFIVSDSAGQHGMQVFDLTRLRSMEPQSNGLPVKVAEDHVYTEIASAHNIVINEESGFAYSVGSSGGGTTCGGGLHMIDIREPKKPVFAGCFSDAGTGRAGTGYSHDAQCVTYKGPDTRYTGHEICIGSNETTVSIADVTDKKAPKAVSRVTYPNVAYAHQGWLTEDHKYFFLNDEGDEPRPGIDKTRTLIFDFTDLENPTLLKEHMGVEWTHDHNLYIKGNLMYQANYRSGLRILNVSDPSNPREVAFFDTAPYTTNTPGFNGAWSVFPYFRSGSIVVSSIEQGLFIVRASDR